MDRKKWYALAILTAGGAALAVYLAPYVDAHQALLPLKANRIFSRAEKALRHDAFQETLTYQNNLLPPELQLAQLINLPVPDGSVSTINLYQDSPTAWRLEELDSSNNVVGVVARARQRLVTYQSDNRQRTVNTLPANAGSPWSLWQIPQPGTWERDWSATAAVSRLGRVAAYKVTLRPKARGTLWGKVTYWFDGRDFVPLGIQVTDSEGAPVFSVTTSTFATRFPRASARPPSSGQVVAWHASPALARLTGQLSAGAAQGPIAFPTQMGPLPRTGEHQTGDNALAVYGQGPGQVMVLSTASRVFKGHSVKPFFRPVSGYRHYEGVTDGIFSVVTFRLKNREITVMGSRPQAQLARWARSEWQ